MTAEPNGALGRDAKHRRWPRLWVLGCAGLLLFGWLGLAGAIIESSTSNLVISILVILAASWWWSRRTAPGASFRMVQGTYQPLLAVVWDVRNWI